jgi:hypothetical protein
MGLENLIYTVPGEVAGLVKSRLMVRDPVFTTNGLPAATGTFWVRSGLLKKTSVFKLNFSLALMSVSRNVALARYFPGAIGKEKISIRLVLLSTPVLGV